MDRCKVGCAQILITPEEPGATAGWGLGLTTPAATPPTDPAEHMYATAIALLDASGERVVFVNADIHSGSRKVWRAAADIAGIDPSELILCGTHTHEGPSQLYGAPAYALAASSLKNIRTSTKRLSNLIGRVAAQAIGALTAGGVSVARVDVPVGASNRAVPAWDHYSAEQRLAFIEDGPGAALATSGVLADQLRDPRLTALIARSDDGTQHAALGWYAVHGTALSSKWKTFSADLWGWARHHAESNLDGVRVGFGGGSSGDISPLPLDDKGYLRTDSLDRPASAGSDLATHVGKRIADAMTHAVTTAEPASFSLGVAHELWQPHQSGLPHPTFGMNQVGGGVDGPTDKWEQVEAGIHAPRNLEIAHRQRPLSHGHGPKTPLLFGETDRSIPIDWLMRWLLPKDVPLTAIRVGDHVFATVPGEPTTMAGWRIEQAMIRAARVSSASVIGFAIDYCGYWATPEEYLEQRYEGASTVYGREASTKLTDRLAALGADLASLQI